LKHPFKAFARLFRPSPTCRDVNSFLSEYVDGSLPPEMRRRFERHLDMCPDCRTWFDQYEATIRMTREDRVDIPERLAEHTLEFLRSSSFWN
jgi:predicted anti-sigma-YlaC factor YlaD